MAGLRKSCTISVSARYLSDEGMTAFSSMSYTAAI
jgi:hypothetical protein